VKASVISLFDPTGARLRISPPNSHFIFTYTLLLPSLDNPPQRYTMPSPSKQTIKAPKAGKAFRRIRAAMVGDLYQGNLFPQWLRRNGGEFHDKVSDKITHLIASEQAYEDNVEEGEYYQFHVTPCTFLSHRQ
jgi:hypothetical protein